MHICVYTCMHTCLSTCVEHVPRTVGKLSAEAVITSARHIYTPSAVHGVGDADINGCKVLAA